MAELAQVLRHVIPSEDAQALVDASASDDAAVYLLEENRALVVTTDFFTPIVDDPFHFGQIAAANALSDLYAMAAEPLFALNLVAFPRKYLKEPWLGEILRGGAEKAREAGIPVLGGHSIDDPEPKYGLVAVGVVDPDVMTTNAGAAPGDRLLLTKPLGTGIISTALKAQQAPPEAMEAAIRSMSALNRAAADAAKGLGIKAATDVSGFGLLGHLSQMLRASGCSARIRAQDVPLFPGVIELARDGHVPGGTRRNLKDLGDQVVSAQGVGDLQRLVLADAQTSGGLLLSVPEGVLEPLGERLAGVHTTWWEIGRVRDGPPGRIELF
jgi:selenide,water dikinase